MADISRPYQNESLDQIKSLFQQNYTKVLLWLATGAGKTFVFCMMIKEAVSRGMHCIVLVRGRKLVDQASERLFREHVAHGVMMAGHWNFRPNAQVQVCSIDTLIARYLRPKADLIIIDECDQATSPGYKEFLADPIYNDSFIVSVTATPWTKEPLSHIAQAVVHPITMEELIEMGWLCGFRYYAPQEPDVADVDVSSSGDYNSNQLGEVMLSGQLTGNIIDHWAKLAKGRPTFCFGVNVKHSKILAERFCAAGIRAEHCDANSSDKERNAIQERVENGTTEVVCNVGIVGRGVDLPRISCVISARPTKSRNLYIQQAGRGTRIFPGKSDCLLLDHAGNISRHGFPTDEPDVNLDGRPLSESAARKSKICKECAAVYRGPICPECGVEPPEREVEIDETADELVEIIAKKDPIKERLKALRKDRGTRTMQWVYFQLKKEFGAAAEPYLPNYLTDAFSASPYSRGVNHGRNTRTRQSAEGRKEKQQMANGKEGVS